MPEQIRYTWTCQGMTTFREFWARSAHFGQNGGWELGTSPGTGCLQLLEILEISWNLKTLLEILEISWNLNGPPGNFCVMIENFCAMIDRIGIRS